MKSEIESKLFQVSLLISEVSFKMSDETQQIKSQCLSAVGVILSQIENLVSSELLSRFSSIMDDSTSSVNVSNFDVRLDSSSSLNDGVCDRSSCRLSWDNNNYNSYYNLFFKDEAEDTTDSILT